MPTVTQHPHRPHHEQQGPPDDEEEPTGASHPESNKRLSERDDDNDSPSAFKIPNKRLKIDSMDEEMIEMSKPVMARKKVSAPSSALPLSSLSSKLNKNDEAEVDVNAPVVGSNRTIDDTPGVDPSELASAFALASLAGMSRGTTNIDSLAIAGQQELRDMKKADAKDKRDEVVRRVASWDETRSPKAEQHPISPEQRSPGSVTTHHETPTESSMDDRSVSSASGRKVHFAPNTKETSSPSSGAALKARLAASRKLVMPKHRTIPPSPSHPNAGNSPGMTMSPRPQTMIGAGSPMSPFARTPPHINTHPNFLHGAPYPPPHHSSYHHPHLPHHLQSAAFHPHMSAQQYPPPHFVSPPHGSPHRSFFPSGPGLRAMGYPQVPRHLLQPPLLHHPSTPGHMMGGHNQPAGPFSMERHHLQQSAASAAEAAAAQNQWICDYCNDASFGTYEEACLHEESCKMRHVRSASTKADADPHSSLAAPRSLISTSRSRSDASVGEDIAPTASGSHLRYKHGDASLVNPYQNWHQGTLCLAIEESDREWLSELNCFIRSHCVEAFSATEEDVKQSSKRGRISLHQVGIRCRFCAHLPPISSSSSKESKESDNDSADGEATTKGIAAVSFPTSIPGIYESVKRWQRVHLDVCEHIPATTRDRLNALGSTNVWVPTTRQYWADAAIALGLVDTDDGIRFGQDPASAGAEVKRITKTPSGEEPSPERSPHSFQRHLHGSPGGMVPAGVLSGMTHLHHAAFGISDGDRHPHPSSPASEGPTMNQAGTGTGRQLSPQQHVATLGGHIIFPEDMEMVPPYVYYLMRQVEPCLFTEADRFVARSKGPVGYPGFQCRHCSGHAGLGKYFPVSSKSLSTNSTSQNIHAHLLKCRKCPGPVKDRLVQLKIEKTRAPRLEPGWRKIFFDRVWARLHRNHSNMGGNDNNT